jgi:hypothetical protein
MFETLRQQHQTSVAFHIGVGRRWQQPVALVEQMHLDGLHVFSGCIDQECLDAISPLL